MYSIKLTSRYQGNSTPCQFWLRSHFHLATITRPRALKVADLAFSALEYPPVGYLGGGFESNLNCFSESD